MSGMKARLGQAEFEVRAGESLLDACRRSAVTIPFSCGAGVCQACLLKCVDGEVPAPAQRGLSADLSAKGYLLACQCHPTGEMALAMPDPADRRISGMLHSAERSGPFVHLRFETARLLPCEPGDRLSLESPGAAEEILEVTSVEADTCTIEALATVPAAASHWLLEAPFGADLVVRGPLPFDPKSAELAPPQSDPQLWQEMGDGLLVRAVLQDFYEKVYADSQLAPFFDGVTQQRLVEKQYSFLKQLLTGERVYFGDRPRNAHHWMVISGALFEHREALMREQLVAHGLTESQIARWMRIESHYRRDIVKAQAWPRVVGGVELPLDGYGKQVLDEGTVCDHCGEAVDAGTEVLYHLRLGRVSCPECAPA
jgi:ferredoxin/truncated hemoglobin YjbI